MTGLRERQLPIGAWLGLFGFALLGANDVRAQDAGEPLTDFSRGLDAGVLLAPTYVEDAALPPVVLPPMELAEPEEEQASAPALGAIVVTARYRQEDAQEVPIAITTLSSDQLGALQGTRNLNQISTQLPALNIQGFSGRNQTITIRGLGTNAGGTNDGLEQGVGLYVDGVYRPRTGSVITDMLDVDSVQLLRGPQGTLFGKNTVAGAIDIRTVEPNWQRSARAEITYGNYNYARASFSVNMPITDELTFRASYLRTSRDGLFYNTTYDEKWDDLNNDAGRVDILYKPSTKFKTRLTADYSMQRCDCGFYVTRRVLPTTLADGRTVRGFYEKSQTIGYTPQPIDVFRRRTDIDASQSDKMPSWGVQNRADWSLPADLTLTSISAYRQWKWLPHYDGDAFGADISRNSIALTHQQQFSQEFRISSPGGETIDYTAGLYFLWQEADDRSIQSYGRQASQWLIGPTANPATLNNLTAYAKVIPATASYAAFGQASWNITKSTHLTGGLRLTYEHKTGLYDSDLRGDVAPLDSLPEADRMAAAASRNSYAPTTRYKDSLNVKNASGTLVFSQDIGHDFHGFVSYSRGYKSPGINLVRKSAGVDVFVDQEEVDDVELGLKTAYFGSKLEINPTLFYTIDRNYQANYSNTMVMPAVQYITNVGTLVSRGVEVDARLYPVKGLSGTASFMYNDAFYDSYKNAPAQYLNSYLGAIDLSGKQASGAPRFAAGAALEYGQPIARLESGALDGYFGGDWGYRSHFRAGVNLDPFSEIPGYHLVGLHAGVRQLGRWDLSFWMRNVADTNYFITSAVNSQYGIVNSALGEPRTFGATLRGQL
ncbi:MAG TPA: TonB-dependent receptor [Polyangiales bacterium]|nr:TonB-dependent receptor [Polyangiales bacterium]